LWPLTSLEMLSPKSILFQISQTYRDNSKDLLKEGRSGSVSVLLSLSHQDQRISHSSKVSR